jgi:hypothetical protein
MRNHSKKRGAWAWGGLSKVTGQGGREDRKVNFEDLVIAGDMCQFPFFASIIFGDKSSLWCSTWRTACSSAIL